VARIGGDEFMVLLPVVESHQDALTVAKKICTALNQPFSVDGVSISTSSSVGIALFPLQGDDAQTLFQQADRALYRAKAQGRNCVELAQ